MAQEPTTLGEVTVTAQKRTENLQNVPISLATLDTKTLEELHVQTFKDYVQMLPSVSMQPGLGAGSGFSAVYMRGVATGADGQATTSQPSVGMYLDEQPITTIQGNLDIHLYDIARVEALAGPQGTLYGAQFPVRHDSHHHQQARSFGIRVRLFAGRKHGRWRRQRVCGGRLCKCADQRQSGRSPGGLGRARRGLDRQCAWHPHVPGDIETTADDVTVDNADKVEKNYNTIDTIGARAALRIELNDNWTFTPSIQTQKQEQEGSWGADTQLFRQRQAGGDPFPGWNSRTTSGTRPG